MIEKALAICLLKVAQSPAQRVEFHASATLRKFVAESGIGIVQGRKIFFSKEHKERVRLWLRTDKIDPDTSVDAWLGIGRAEALRIGPNEKWAGSAVRAERIAIKALNGNPLLLGDQSIFLPPLANVEWNYIEALQSLHHDVVIVVENWEVFERIDDFKINMSHTSKNPLIIWRGGGSQLSVGAAMRFIEAYRRPVWSAPDYDPEGLAIASRLPYLVGVLAPSDDMLRHLLSESKLHERYTQQLLGAQTTLEQATHPDIIRLWEIIRASRNAIPQEQFCHKR